MSALSEEPDRKRFAEVARIIGGDPDEVLRELERYSPLIAGRKRGPESEAGDRELFVYLNLLEERLMDEAKVMEALEQQFGYDLAEELDAVNDALNAFSVLMEYVKSNLSPPRKGGQTPDRKRRLCATVCLSLWHEGSQPYSNKLWQACEEYWKACGKPGLGPNQDAKIWQHYLVEVADELSHQ
jgi:hypothetical protein